MRYLTGAEVARVAAIEANVGGHDIDVEDAAAVSLGFDNGMIGSLHAGYFTSGDGEVSIGLRGSEGWIKWEVDEGQCTIKSDAPGLVGGADRAGSTYPQRRFPAMGQREEVIDTGLCGRHPRRRSSSGYTVEEIIKSLADNRGCP